MFAERPHTEGHSFSQSPVSVSIVSADQLNLTTVFVRVQGLHGLPEFGHIQFLPGLQVVSVSQAYDGLMIETSPMRWDEVYRISIAGCEPRLLNQDPWLDSLFSEKPLGYQLTDTYTRFGVFAPRASEVKLVLFADASSENYTEHPMNRDEDGVWELFFPESLDGYAYGYRVIGRQGDGEWFNPDVIIADPYSPAVTTMNTFHHQARTLIRHFDFDWKDAGPVAIPRNELIIYEAHLRNLTVHPSAGCSAPGTYLGFVDESQRGGLPHLKHMGVNAVEFLPLMEYGNIETPYQKQSDTGVFNTWNPYARNHWGYMTSYFFAPESYYASDGHLNPGQRTGQSGKQVFEMKEMVRRLHSEGLAVIMDVVYNHVSQYDHNPLKLIDKKYYFRLDSHGNPLSESGCGNDLKTERPMARRLIIDSVRHWMTEYHIDGFRFDLAQLIDKETCSQVLAEARKINPAVIMIAEPWGGGYDPNGFSDIGWASWNDQIRNGLKGFHPQDDVKGYVFGRFFHHNDYFSLVRYIRGSLRVDGGPFHKVEHTINYLESHDDHTFGDFIRIGTGKYRHGQKIDNLDEHARLNEHEMKLHKLAALFLFSAQGNVMIHSGQEFGRSQVVAPTAVHDPQVGEISSNSYDKDNDTSYLNFEHADLNQSLVDFYRQLIRLKKTFRVFTAASHRDINFFPSLNSLALFFELVGSTFDEPNFFVAMNSNHRHPSECFLPEGKWQVLLANVDGYKPVQSGRMVIHQGEAYLLMKL